MNTRLRTPLSALMLAAALSACGGGSSNPSGGEGRVVALADTVAASGRVSVAAEPAGAACATGGYSVTAWYDANANGTRDEGETASTGYVCNGAAGTVGRAGLVRTATEPAGARCAHGGTRVDAGPDSNGNGRLDDAEVASTGYVCNGSDGAPAPASLFALAAEPAGSLCAAGGTRIQAGADRNGNGTLEPAEVSSSSVVCSGAGGPAGSASLVSVAAEPAGANCANGGTVVAVGRDSNGNGVLDPDEVSSTRFICTGSNGAAGAVGGTGADGLASLLTASAEPPGGNCAAGGTRLSAGTDSNRNGVLDAPEISTTRYLCDGVAGSTGVASLSSILAEPPGARCSQGGSRINSGLDSNGNGSLEPGEVSSTSYACNGSSGSNGANGSNGFTSLVAVASESAGTNCSNGGSRITAGLDSNRNGVLDAGEVTSTSYACNGAAGAIGSGGAAGATALTAVDSEPAGLNCSNGGSRITAGLDINRNGTLDAAEVTSSAYVCNGADSGLAWTSVSNGPVAVLPQRSYVAQAALSRLRFKLPANPAVGDTVRVVGAGVAGWEIVPSGTQWIDTVSAGADAVRLDSLLQDFRAAGNLVGGTCAMTPDARRLANAPDGRLLRTSRDGGLTTDSFVLTLTNPSWFIAVWSGDGSTLLLGQTELTGGTLQRWTNDLRVQTALPLTGLFADAALSEDGQVMLVAGGQKPNIPGPLYVSADAGASWRTVGPTLFWQMVSVSRDGRVMLASATSSGLTAGGLYLSTDSGSTWQVAQTGEWFASAMTPDGRRLFALGPNQALARSDDRGSTWTRSNPATLPAGGFPAQLALAATGQALVAAFGSAAPTGIRQLYRSDDAGATWQDMNRSAVQTTGSGCLALSADGTRLLANSADGNTTLLSSVDRYVTATSLGSDGLLQGEQYGSVELQYQGSGRWVLLNHRGTLRVQ